MFNNDQVLTGAVLYVLPHLKHTKVNTVEDTYAAYVEVNLWESNAVEVSQLANKSQAEKMIIIRAIKYILETRIVALRFGKYEVPNFTALKVYPPKMLDDIINN